MRGSHLGAPLKLSRQIHFNADIQAATKIGFDGEPVDSLVWVDRKLKRTNHVQEATRKGAAQFEAVC
jgi:hypothetical protein